MSGWRPFAAAVPRRLLARTAASTRSGLAESAAPCDPPRRSRSSAASAWWRSGGAVRPRTSRLGAVPPDRYPRQGLQGLTVGVLVVTHAAGRDANGLGMAPRSFDVTPPSDACGGRPGDRRRPDRAPGTRRRACTPPSTTSVHLSAAANARSRPTHRSAARRAAPAAHADRAREPRPARHVHPLRARRQARRSPPGRSDVVKNCAHLQQRESQGASVRDLGSCSYSISEARVRATGSGGGGVVGAAQRHLLEQAGQHERDQR